MPVTARTSRKFVDFHNEGSQEFSLKDFEAFSSTAQELYQHAQALHKQVSQQFDERTAHLARRAYEQVLELDENNVDALTNYAVLLEQLGESELSFQYLGEALKAAPSNPLIRINLALSFLEQGNFEKANFHLGEAAEVDSWNPLIPQLQTYVHLAQVQSELKFLDLKAARNRFNTMDGLYKTAQKMSEQNSPDMQVLQTTRAKVEQVLLAMEEGFMPDSEDIVDMTPVPMIGFAPNRQTPSAINDNAA